MTPATCSGWTAGTPMGRARRPGQSRLLPWRAPGGSSAGRHSGAGPDRTIRPHRGTDDPAGPTIAGGVGADGPCREDRPARDSPRDRRGVGPDGRVGHDGAHGAEVFAQPPQLVVYRGRRRSDPPGGLVGWALTRLLRGKAHGLRSVGFPPDTGERGDRLLPRPGDAPLGSARQIHYTFQRAENPPPTVQQTSIRSQQRRTTP